MIPVLVLCDDFWHPAEIIERGFKSLKQTDYSFDFCYTPKDVLTPEWVKQFPVIVCAKGPNRLNSANQNGWFDEGVTEFMIPDFEAYVKEGGGFISLHAGNTARDKEVGWGPFVGNIFQGHPPRCEIDVKITGKHPIVDGISDFVIRDEHYAIEVIDPNAIELFRTVSASGGDQPAGYAIERGKGRLAALTPGHILSVFENPSFAQILLNTLKWVRKAA
ncbi:MAG: ThuA domain-containing protein [Treponema sp.]|nr:ThuA domain-containing protein [Treponema sp.]